MMKISYKDRDFWVILDTNDVLTKDSDNNYIRVGTYNKKEKTDMMDNNNETGPINLGKPEGISILEIAKEIIELTNSKSEIIYKKLPEDGPLKRKPDISLAKKVLNWEPKSKRKYGIKSRENE